MNQSHPDDGTMTQVQVTNVPRTVVLKPSHCMQRLTHQKFELGDQVICAFDQGSVPLGAKGHVIAVDRNYLEVVFEKVFMGGTDLNGRCSAYRGALVDNTMMLNLTHPQPPTTSVVKKSNQDIVHTAAHAPNKNVWKETKGPVPKDKGKEKRIQIQKRPQEIPDQNVNELTANLKSLLNIGK